MRKNLFPDFNFIFDFNFLDYILYELMLRGGMLRFIYFIETNFSAYNALTVLIIKVITHSNTAVFHSLELVRNSNFSQDFIFHGKSWSIL